MIRSKTFREAVRSCRFEHGAELASIHSATVNEYLSNFASVTDEYNEDHEHYGAWIGLHRLAGNSTRWRWVDGTPADYLPFDEDTVKASTRKRSQRLCVAILNSQWTEHKLWSAAQCDTANQTAICQKLP
ncbi:Protein CLEC-49 [Aphelenchoides avenae]|nr:Protein CLEC-49 [Aphelenchus avenae]